IHQEALASTHATPHVNAARNIRALEQTLERRCPILQIAQPVLVELLQPVNGRLLGYIRLVAFFIQHLQVILAYIHVSTVQDKSREKVDKTEKRAIPPSTKRASRRPPFC